MPNPDNKDPLAPKQDNSWLEAIPIKETPWSKSTMDSNAKGVPEATPSPRSWGIARTDGEPVLYSIYETGVTAPIASVAASGSDHWIIERIVEVHNRAVNSYSALQAQNKLLREACEAALVAIELLRKWVGPPPTGPYDFDSLREDGWHTSTVVLTQLRQAIRGEKQDG